MQCLMAMTGTYIRGKLFALFQAHQDIKLESARNVTMDRQTLYCVPVPGENNWLKQISFFTGTENIYLSKIYNTNKIVVLKQNTIQYNEASCVKNQSGYR